MSAKQVVSKAVSNLKAAPTFGLSGKVTEPGGDYTLHLDYKRRTGCEGTIAQAGKGSFTLVVIGTTAWVKPTTRSGGRTRAATHRRRSRSSAGGT
jgi:hypothetical protein